MTDHNPTPNADAAPVVEGELQRRLQREIEIAASGGNIALTVLVETKQRLDHLEARERAGRELGERLGSMYDCSTGSESRKIITLFVLNDILTHLDGGSTND